MKFVVTLAAVVGGAVALGSARCTAPTTAEVGVADSVAFEVVVRDLMRNIPGRFVIGPALSLSKTAPTYRAPSARDVDARVRVMERLDITATIDTADLACPGTTAVFPADTFSQRCPRDSYTVARISPIFIMVEFNYDAAKRRAPVPDTASAMRVLLEALSPRGLQGTSADFVLHRRERGWGVRRKIERTSP